MRRATPRLEPHGPMPPLRVGRTGRAIRVRRLRAAVRPGPDDPGGAGRHETGARGRSQGPRTLAGRADFVGAERLLRRISIRTLDQRRERVLQGIVEKAQARVRYAEERGGNVEEAERHLVEARNALALREYHRIRPLASKAIEKADAQRKYARAETTLDRAAADVDAARRDGVNIAEARKVLT